MQFKKILVTASLLLAATSMAWGQAGIGPSAQPLPAPIAAPRDIGFAGVMQLSVDASDTAHRIFTVHQRIPVQQAGDMVLLYPQWETGSHSATASAASFAGLTVHAAGRRLEWRRDPVDVFAFHLVVPSGAQALDIDFQYLSPLQGARVMSPDMLTLAWQSVLVYPAGWYARDIPVTATLRLPDGFAYGTSLSTAAQAGGAVTFKTTSLEDLVDAPVYAGRHFKRIALLPGGEFPAWLDLVADSEKGLDIPAALQQQYAAMAVEVPRLFRSRHFDHYDFLLSLTDVLPSGGGLEHLRSGENNFPADYFADPHNYLVDADLVIHEYVHSWNGRYRQPADLWSPNFNLPVSGSLLWVYEGQTEFWGRMLAARFGMRSYQETLDAIALDAATAQARTGRAWKSLADSTADPLYMPGRAVPWRDWQRREDYYGEGVLLWLDVDMLMRERSGGKASLADFAAAFFGADPRSEVTRTYTFDDICKSLNAVVPYDWASFLNGKLQAHDADHLLDGLQRAGYRLVFTDTETEMARQKEIDDGVTDLSYSIGLAVGNKGVVKSLAWQGPAFKAGLGIGARIVSVNGQPYEAELLKAAVRQAAAQPLSLGFELDGQARTATVDYRGSLRYPRLERIAGSADRLKALLLP